MRVLPAGATGLVGRCLPAALPETGLDLVALARDADSVDTTGDADVFDGDPLDPASLSLPVDHDGADYLVHSLATGPEFADRDRRAPANVVAVARVAGIDRVSYLGGLGHRARTSRSIGGPARRSRSSLQTMVTLHNPPGGRSLTSTP